MNTFRSHVDGIYKQVESLIDRLEQRWQHERENEDFADYVKVITKALVEAEPEVNVGRIQSDPFEIRFTINGKNIRIFVNPKQMGWEEVQ